MQRSSRSSREARNGITRRDLLVSAARGAVLLPVAGALAACGGSESDAPPPAPAATPEPAPAPPAAAPAKPAPAPAAEADPNALVTELPAMTAQVTALQYVNASAKPDQNCANCLFYTAGEGGRGKCQLFPKGLVSSGGWCASWAAKPA